MQETKAKQYAKIARRMLEQISGNWEEWTKFLSTASRVYKYPFLDQLMIYAQRPDATACADYETWNRQMGRSIRRGASGIALLDDASGHLRLRYVFDITDTVMRENSRTPWLWTVEERHHNRISAMLEHSYGARETDLSQQLIRVADRVSVEYWEDQKEEIFDRLRAREYDGIITEELFFSVVRPSIAYQGLSLPWEMLVSRYKNIESGHDEQIKMSAEIAAKKAEDEKNT